MASTRTICTECKSVVTLPEPAEVGDVVACPKCEAYFTVPKTKIVPTPGAAKPATAAKPVAAAIPAKPKPKVVVEADDEDDLPPIPRKKPVAVVEDDDEEEDEEEEERPKKKKKAGGSSGGKKKKKKRKEEEKSFKNSPVRYAILGVLVLVMLVGAYFLYKKMMKGDPPDIVIQATEPDLSKPLTKEEIEANRKKSEQNKAKSNSQGPRTGLPSVDRQKATNELKQLALGYMNHLDALNKPPAKPGDLLTYVENKSSLIKDVEDGVYVLYMNVRLNTLPGGTSNTVLGYVHDVPQKGGMVLFADGSVRQMNVKDFEDAPKAGK